MSDHVLGSAPDPQGADEPGDALFMGAISLPDGGVPDEPGDDDLAELVRYLHARCEPNCPERLLLAEVERLRVAAPASEDDRLFMLDVWVALGGDESEFERVHSSNTPADFWTWLLAKVVALRNGGTDG